jgi:protein-disulfide isomerase
MAGSGPMGHHEPVNDNDPTGAPASAAPDPEPSVVEPAPPVPVAPVEPVAPTTAEIQAATTPRDPVRTQNRLAILGTVALVVALAFGGGFAVGRATAPAGTSGETGVLVPATPSPGSSTDPGTSAAPSGAQPTVIPSGGPDLPSDGARLGAADAKVVIDYWADFQCPFCAKFAQETIPQLVPLIEDGTVAVVHRDYAFLGPESLDAAVAVRCAADDGKYWAMHDAVYAAQDGENQGGFARPKLVAIGQSIGLDGAKLEACLDDRATLVDVLDDTSEAVRTGIKSTPTVIVNGRQFLGVPDIAELTAAVEAAAAGASPEPAGSPTPTDDPWAGITLDGRTAGDPAAPVTVHLWMDYQATDNAAIGQELSPELKTRLKDGKIKVVLHDLALLGDESVVAATALRCTAAQGGPAWFVHDILSISGQGAGSGIYSPRNLLRLVAQLGMDVPAFDACLEDPSVAQAVRDETAQGSADAMTAGPVIVVTRDGKESARFSGTLDTAKVLQAIDAAK